jgi:hypothetical protein
MKNALFVYLPQIGRVFVQLYSMGHPLADPSGIELTDQEASALFQFMKDIPDYVLMHTELKTDDLIDESFRDESDGELESDGECAQILVSFINSLYESDGDLSYIFEAALAKLRSQNKSDGVTPASQSLMLPPAATKSQAPIVEYQISQKKPLQEDAEKFHIEVCDREDLIFDGLLLKEDAAKALRENGWDAPTWQWDLIREKLEYLYGSAAEFRSEIIQTLLEQAEELGLSRSSAQQTTFMDLLNI